METIAKRLDKRTSTHGSDAELLHRTALVLLMACWETFVEDLATSAFDAMLLNPKTPNVFPPEVLRLASAGMRSGDDLVVWNLANMGWAKVLKKYREKVLKEYVERLHTPGAPQVDKLFAVLIGLKGLSREWEWPRMSRGKSLERLSRLVKRRGEIAHRVTASTRVQAQEVSGGVQFVTRIAIISSNRVDLFVQKRSGILPWDQLALGDVL